MQASKSRPDVENFDTFRCQSWYHDRRGGAGR